MHLPSGRVRRRHVRQRRVERCVEDRDVRQAGKHPARIGECRKRGRVVKRRELDQLPQRRLDLVVDHDRFAKPGPAVDDAMGNPGKVARRVVERQNRLSRDAAANDRELQARRAGVDDEDRACAQPGQVQLRTSGWSSPCSRVHAR